MIGRRPEYCWHSSFRCSTGRPKLRFPEVQKRRRLWRAPCESLPARASPAALNMRSHSQCNIAHPGAQASPLCQDLARPRPATREPLWLWRPSPKLLEVRSRTEISSRDLFEDILKSPLRWDVKGWE